MIHIATIVGARPQFIKASVLSRLIRGVEGSRYFHETIIHTGQHYDDDMSAVFFRDMQIAEPDVNLNIGSGTHGQMTGRMLNAIEPELIKFKPDLVLVYGDTNSTLAGALAASKLGIPVAHVEAGLRSFFKKMPEEQNRVLTDHISDFLFCPTSNSVKNLANEGIKKGVFQVGDIMLDACIYYSNILRNGDGAGIPRSNKIKELLASAPKSKFILATIHRAENTDDPEKLANIVGALNELNEPIILPLHPRTKKVLLGNNLTFNNHVNVTGPLGYLEMLELEMNCKCILTDSGGVQKEAFFMKKPCFTLREQTEWVETVESGWNTLVGTNKMDIIQAIKNADIPIIHPEYFGNGNCGLQILNHLSSIS